MFIAKLSQLPCCRRPFCSTPFSLYPQKKDQITHLSLLVKIKWRRFALFILFTSTSTGQFLFCLFFFQTKSPTSWDPQTKPDAQHTHTHTTVSLKPENKIKKCSQTRKWFESTRIYGMEEQVPSFFFFLQFFLSAFHVEPHGRNAVEALNGRCPTHRTNNYIYKMERKRQRRRSVRDPRVDPSPIKKKFPLFKMETTVARAHPTDTFIANHRLVSSQKKKKKIENN